MTPVCLLKTVVTSNKCSSKEMCKAFLSNQAIFHEKFSTNKCCTFDNALGCSAFAVILKRIDWQRDTIKSNLKTFSEMKYFSFVHYVNNWLSI